MPEESGMAKVASGTVGAPGFPRLIGKAAASILPQEATVLDLGA